MKRLVIAGLLAIMCLGCDNSLPQTSTKPLRQGDISTISHEGHKFVIYREVDYYAGMGGIVHHPDCQCLKEIK